ncbi:O-antigen translocase [Wohlfahrtiimonas chitiniclastica]|uniref:O-antigen translocase n=1 Tax=Wohlfahrtiimonas chitiniclastica TaxID=400946 RepID=UPI0007B4011E|nr:O-antigen translocase [Wohlfahrtiimonas chitiniclastica]KZS23633.1 polysaccharide biosynthesis protein [Wohlfahrtiimonas chitiniclastica]WHR56025.1 O-antigen translocase [Wohlfahrtiimonas chitiniclastica]
MGLFKTSILNGIAVLIKMATMFVLNKILAIYVGPSGYAVIGQFQNFIQVITMFTGTAINNGIIKYTAEYHNDAFKQQQIWHSATKFILLISFAFSVLIFFFRGYLSNWIFRNNEFEYVFTWLAIFLVFFNINTLLLAILNGTQQIKRLVIANIFGSLLSLIITGMMAVQYGLSGALVAISIYQSLNFFITFTLCRNIKWFSYEIVIKKSDFQVIKKLLPFALMAFTTIILGNFAQIYLRDLIIQSFNLQYAGYWDAMNRLSGAYLMLATTILSVYYLPKLSSLKRYSEIKKEVYFGYKSILPIAVISSLAIFLLQKDIVLLLFSQDFIPMLDLMLWQLIGDVIKIGSWIISFMMISKAMTREFIIIEAIFLLSIIPLTYICIEIFEFKGISIAFALNCLFYWITCSIFSFKKLKALSHE